MPKKLYSPFHSLIQRIAASKPGAWFFARTLHHFDRIFLKLSGGRETMTGLVGGLPVVFLTSKGAKSGLPRTVPLLCVRDESDPVSFALIATNWGQKPYPAWYFNLKANPKATCSIAGQVGQFLHTRHSLKNTTASGNMPPIPTWVIHCTSSGLLDVVFPLLL